MQQKKKSSFMKKVLALVLFFCAIYGFGVYWLQESFVLQQDIMVQQGDSLARFTRAVPTLDQWKLKLYAKLHTVDTTNIAVGLYRFTGDYTAETFFSLIAAGPQKDYVSYTVLEGRSIYDIDADLAKKGYASAGEYIAYVTDAERIRTLTQEYDFLDIVLQDEQKLSTLEGFLYPDTYFIDLAKPVLPQLLRHHLQTFDRKVWQVYAEEFVAFQKKVRAAGYDVLDLYDTVILASIIEKEERFAANKPTIAGIFLARLAQKMLLGADVTLCYGLHMPYSVCTQDVINEKVSDATNPFNTRKNPGLTSQPIANISAATFSSVLHFEPGEYLYYLHDAEGNIHYAKTLEEHVLNKKNYID